MTIRTPTFVLKWAVAALALCALLASAYEVHSLMQTRQTAESLEDQPDRRTPKGIKFSVESAEGEGLQVAPARMGHWQPSVRVYGRVVPNPRAAVELRSPFAGTLQPAPPTPWPSPGQRLKAGHIAGRVDIRVSALEKLDIQAKLSEARIKLKGAEEILKVRQARLDQLKSIPMTEVVSPRELDDAVVQWAEADTQMASAKKTVELWEQAQKAINRAGNGANPTWSAPLMVPADGEVTELLAQPGTAVEAGALLARLVDFRRALVRLDFPPDRLFAGPPQRIELTAVSTIAQAPADATNLSPGLVAPPVQALLLGQAPQIDVASQFSRYWYLVRGVAPENWRPGLFVQTDIMVPGVQPQPAVLVPASALLYHVGKNWVYVRVRPDLYERREVQILGRQGADSALATGPIAKGESVVSHNPQVLLSEEFKPGADTD